MSKNNAAVPLGWPAGTVDVDPVSAEIGQYAASILQAQDAMRLRQDAARDPAVSNRCARRTDRSVPDTRILSPPPSARVSFIATLELSLADGARLHRSSAGWRTSVLAECSGQAWLVRGEQHIDELLANLLEPHVTIEVVACELKSAVNALAYEYGAAPGTELWLIHPAIVNRARGETAVSADFSEWSALLSERALTDLSTIAALALRSADMNIVLTCYIAADAATTAINRSKQVSVKESITKGSESAQEFANVRVLAAGHLLGGAEESDALVREESDLARHSEGGSNVVGDDDAGDAELALQLENKVSDGRRRERIEARSRLVVEHDLGIVGQAARDADALLHAARKLGWHLIHHFLRLEVDELELLAHARLDLVLVEVRVLAQRIGDVLVDGHRVEQRRALEDHPHLLSHLERVVEGEVGDVFAVDGDSALIGDQQPEQQLEDRRFSGTGFADDDDRLALSGVERDVLENRLLERQRRRSRWR